MKTKWMTKFQGKIRYYN